MAPQFFPSFRAGRPRPQDEILTGDLLPELTPEAKTIWRSYATALYASGAPAYGAAQNWSVEQAVAVAYERTIWCFRAIGAIGGQVARADIPFQVSTGDAKNPRVVDGHPIARLLNGMANEIETGDIFLRRLSAQLLLSKRGAFVEVTKSRMGTPIRLDLLPPGRTRPVPGWPVAPMPGQPLPPQRMISHFEVTRQDGSTYDIGPENVRWVRNPHPLDPYSGVTPLEAAALSVELDYFARLYNAQFLKNDGRPALIVSVDGDLQDKHLARLDAQFGRGPVAAGSVSTITGGKVTVSDMGSKPRDMGYPQLAANAKVETLAAFGVPESRLGNASGRTFDNAAEEGWAFWSLTMTDHMSLMACAFTPDVDFAGGEVPGWDLSKVTELQIPEQRRRAEMREEYDKGLRSIKSYADAAGYGDDIDDTPATRALYVPAGRTPIAARKEDEVALGLAPDPNAPAPPAPGQQDPNATPGAPQATPAQPATGAGNPDVPLLDEPAASGVSVAGAGATPPPGGTATPRLGETKDLARAAALAETKAAPKGAGQWHAIDPAPTEPAARAAIHAALTAVGTAHTERARGRVKAPSMRKGTRHFAPEYANDSRVGTKALDAAHAADEDGTAQDTERQLRPLIADAALAAAAAWLAAATGRAVTPGSLPRRIADAVIAAASAVIPSLVSGAAWQARKTGQAIAAIDTTGGTVADMLTALDDRGPDIERWAATAAEDAASAATEAAHQAAATEYAGGALTAPNDPAGKPDVAIDRTWLSRRDELTRDDHRAAHGQTVPLGASFKVGDALLRFPKDPLGPPAQVKNCRCRSSWRQRATGKFVPVTSNPATAVEAVS